jgi:uncharacterized protein (DUF2147 family)
MKNYLSLLALCIAIFYSQQSIAEMTNGDAILGVWINAEQDGYIKIYKKAKTFEGIVVGGLNPDDTKRVDINNPDPKRRNQSLLGLIILRGFNFDGANRWTGGQLYDPNNGKTYQGNLELIDDDKLALRGYVGISLFGRTENWARKN